MANEPILIIEDNEKNRKLIRDLLQVYRERDSGGLTKTGRGKKLPLSSSWTFNSLAWTALLR
jgi:hypothetical protein